jgi:hypothetical protein
MRIKTILPLCFLLTFTGAALAQTPDGLPPARETVCDAETGAAYGFCNAYCEAMDCDSDAPNASATACGKVRSKFQNVAGRDVPCELSCPCTSIPQFNAVLEGVNFCSTNSVVTLLSVTGQELDPYIGADPTSCAYLDFLGGVGIILPATPEESTACHQLLREAAASRNVTCNP